jgi:hypothetical protein
MAIEFVVEDGTGKADATSYGSVDDFRQFWQNRGTDYGSHLYSDEQVQVALNKATDYVDGLYPWRGIKGSTTQALEFPRSYCYDDRDRYYDSDTVPSIIKKGMFIAAGYTLEGNEFFDGAVASNVTQKSMGPVSVSFGFGGEKPIRIPEVERAIGPLVKEMGVRR